nr:alpha-amylase family glycosyl hydrolase [Phycicoccus sonneraticus]
MPEPPSGPARPDEHRLLRLLPWLDHVVALGANGVALGPVFASEHHGYDTLDHRRLDPRLGEEADLDRFVEEAHARGLRVQLDGVFNHVGRGHRLVADALRDGPDSPAGRMVRHEPDGSGSLRPATWEGHDELVALDHDAPEVADLVVGVMRHWLDRGADAWRLDVGYAVPPAFWARVLPEVRRTHPDAWFEAEVIHGDYAQFVRDSTVDTVTQYELWKAVWSSLQDRNLHELDHALGRHDAFLDTFVPATFVGNHDVTRIASTVTDARHHPHATVLLAVLGGTPEVYAGDELGLRGVKEERFGGDDAVRPDLGTDPTAVPGADGAVFALHQELVGLRRRHPWLHRARSSAVSLTNTQYVLDVTGEGDGGTLRVALNLDDAPLDLDTTGLLAADDGTRGRDTGVAPHGWAVLGR